MFWGFLEAYKKVWSMEKNNLSTMITNSLTPNPSPLPGLTVVKASKVFLKAFLTLRFEGFSDPLTPRLWQLFHMPV